MGITIKTVSLFKNINVMIIIKVIKNKNSINILFKTKLLYANEMRLNGEYTTVYKTKFEA